MLKVTHYTVNSPKIENMFDDFKIVQLSDLHGRLFSNNYRCILEILETIRPDIVVLTGDMADNRLKRSIGRAELLCGLIAREFATYFVQGNHEQTMRPDELRGFLGNLERSGVCVLDNKKCAITRDYAKIVLNGLVTPIEFYNDQLHEYRKGTFLQAEDIRQLMGTAEDGCYNLLFTHNPIFFETYSAWGADLVLSGHIHGGVIYIPGVGGVLSPDVTFFPKYYAGEYDWEERRLIVSRGLNNRFPFSITNPSEIVCITLRSGEKNDRIASRKMDSKYRDMIEKIKQSSFLEVSGDFDRVHEMTSSVKKYEGSEAVENKDPFLSIVVPTYKRPSLLKETLESIVSQRGFEDYEIVVVDNAGAACIEGTSETEKVITEVDNSRIRYYRNEKNISSGDNWNMCLALARGEWVCMVHDDDVLLPDSLWELYEQVKRNPDIEFLGCVNYSFQGKEELENIETTEKAAIYGIGYEEFMYGMPVMLLGAFFKRSRAIEIGGFDTISYMQDYVFVAKFAYYFKVYLYKKTLYGYRISMNQDSANNEMNYVRRVADYYLWKAIAQKRTGFFQKLYLKNCQYNLKNRIREYNSSKQYGAEHFISLDDIFEDCDIDKSRLHEWEYYFCKGLHFINMVMKKEVR